MDHQNILNSIETIRQSQEQITRSNVGGYQSYPIALHKFDNTTVKELFEKYIIPAAKDIGKNWGYPITMNKGSYWYNINKKYNFNKTHWHPNAYLSGIYYIKVPDNCGNIVFQRAESETDRMGFIIEELFNQNGETKNNRINTHHWFIPKEGTLFMFPGHLSHYVEQNLTEDLDDSRISLSFNFL